MWAYCGPARPHMGAMWSPFRNLGLIRASHVGEDGIPGGKGGRWRGGSEGGSRPERHRLGAESLSATETCHDSVLPSSRCEVRPSSTGERMRGWYGARPRAWCGT